MGCYLLWDPYRVWESSIAPIFVIQFTMCQSCNISCVGRHPCVSHYRVDLGYISFLNRMNSYLVPKWALTCWGIIPLFYKPNGLRFQQYCTNITSYYRSSSQHMKLEWSLLWCTFLDTLMPCILGWQRYSRAITYRLLLNNSLAGVKS